MKTKPLYVLISNGGDGSCYPHYTFDTELINKLQKAYDEDKMDYESGIGCDGDGFHYDVLQVPVECTAASLNTSMLDEEDFEEIFNGGEEE